MEGDMQNQKWAANGPRWEPCEKFPNYGYDPMTSQQYLEKEIEENCTNVMEKNTEEGFLTPCSREDTVIAKFRSLYPDICESFSTIELEQLQLFAKKCTDYGLKNIASGTDLKTYEDVQFALMGIWFRISDKVNRWKNIQFGQEFLKKGLTEESEGPLNESLLDTFQDIANYAMIAQMVYRGLWHA